LAGLLAARAHSLLVNELQGEGGGVAENGPGQDFHDAADPRLTSLDDRLRQARRDEAVRTGAVRDGGDAGYALGNRVLAALIGSLVGSALIGWLLDRWFGTTPWVLIVTTKRPDDSGA
jgi:ATP synthase protein I